MPKFTSPGSPSLQSPKVTPMGGTNKDKNPGSGAATGTGRKGPMGLYDVTATTDTTSPAGLSKGPTAFKAGKRGSGSRGKFGTEVPRFEKGPMKGMK